MVALNFVGVVAMFFAILSSVVAVIVVDAVVTVGVVVVVSVGVCRCGI